MSRTGKYSLWVAGLLCVGLMFVGSQDLLASRETETRPLLTAEDIARIAAEAPVCEADDVENSIEGMTNAKPPKKCKDCPRKMGGQCTRISCEPCCYACLGQPLPVCSS